MSHLAFVCPGQGSQAVGMGRTLAEESAAAAAVFAAADAALGESISDLAWNGPADRLDLTENAQPAILAASVAILAGLTERWAASAPPGEGPAVGRIATLRRRYHELGAANPYAAEEHAEVRQRLADLESQRDDPRPCRRHPPRP